MSAMYGNMFDMWSSCGYKMTKDLDVCMDPYGGKDAYGNYLIGDNNYKKKDRHNKANPDKVIYPDPKYKVGDVNMWCLENNDIVVGRIVRAYPASDVVSGEHINRYAINVLVDGIYSTNETYVTENMAIEGLDADTYGDAHKIGELRGFNPLNTNSDKPNNTDFKCDIDDLKMDINDLRTDVKSLLESQYKIEGDLMVAKRPEIGLSVDDTVTSDLRVIKESGTRLDCAVNYCVDNIDTIKEELHEIDNKTKKASKLSKLSFLSNLMI